MQRFFGFLSDFTMSLPFKVGCTGTHRRQEIDNGKLF